MATNVTASINGGAIRRLHEASVEINRAIERSTLGGVPQDVSDTLRTALGKLGIVYEEVERISPPHAPCSDDATVARFTSPDVPLGYDTILGFLAREAPETIHTMHDPVGAVSDDHEEFAAESEELRKPAVEVSPSPEERTGGLKHTYAYPVEVIYRRLQ